jgi:hypothetical protein
MTDLELELRRLSGDIAWPPTPDVSGAVRRRIEAAPERRLRPRLLALGLAVLAVVAGGVLAVSPARTAILDWLGFGGVEIRRVEELSGVPPEGGRLVLGERTTVAEARRRSGHLVLLPAGEGAPDAVYVDTVSPGRPVALVYGSLRRPRLLVLQFRAAPLVEKTLTLETTLERVTVGEEPGLWIEGPRHEFLYTTPEIDAAKDAQRLAGNTLLWRRGPLTLRIEGDLSKAEALRIAESMRP